MNCGRKRRNQTGFTLVEAIIVLVVLSILLGIAVPEVVSGLKTTRAANCGIALRTIEAAKERWRFQYPGAGNPTLDQLRPYFPGGKIPEDPWGVGFQNVTDLSNIATHPYNGDYRYEPAGNNGLENGYNDAFQPVN